MGCQCGKKQGKGSAQPAPPQGSATESYALRTDDGRVVTFGSKLEADAAKVRSGSAGAVIRVVGS